MVEARVQVSLLLGHYNGGGGCHLCSALRGGGYRVSCFIKANAKKRKTGLWSFSQHKSKAFGCHVEKRHRFRPMVSLVCLAREDVQDFVYLTLKPLLRQEEKASPYFAIFNPRVEIELR